MEIRSKIGSMNNAKHRPGGGNVKIFNEKKKYEVDSKCGSMKNVTHKPTGGNIKIVDEKLKVNASSRVGSMDNVKYKPGGGEKKIYDEKLEWHTGSRIGSMDNARHRPGGGDIKIESQKIDFKNKAQSRVGSLENATHTAGGGDKKILDEKPHFRDRATAKVGSLDNVEHAPKQSEVQIYNETLPWYPKGGRPHLHLISEEAEGVGFLATSAGPQRTVGQKKATGKRNQSAEIELSAERIEERKRRKELQEKERLEGEKREREATERRRREHKKREEEERQAKKREIENRRTELLEKKRKSEEERELQVADRNLERDKRQREEQEMRKNKKLQEKEQQVLAKKRREEEERERKRENLQQEQSKRDKLQKEKAENELKAKEKAMTQKSQVKSISKPEATSRVNPQMKQDPKAQVSPQAKPQVSPQVKPQVPGGKKTAKKPLKEQTATPKISTVSDESIVSVPSLDLQSVSTQNSNPKLLHKTNGYTERFKMTPSAHRPEMSRALILKSTSKSPDSETYRKTADMKIDFAKDGEVVMQKNVWKATKLPLVAEGEPGKPVARVRPIPRPPKPHLITTDNLDFLLPSVDKLLDVPPAPEKVYSSYTYGQPRIVEPRYSDSFRKNMSKRDRRQLAALHPMEQVEFLDEYFAPEYQIPSHSQYADPLSTSPEDGVFSEETPALELYSDPATGSVFGFDSSLDLRRHKKEPKVFLRWKPGEVLFDKKHSDQQDRAYMETLRAKKHQKETEESFARKHQQKLQWFDDYNERMRQRYLSTEKVTKNDLLKTEYLLV